MNAGTRYNRKFPVAINGSQTQVFADSVPIGAGVLDHCTILPTCYLVPFVVHVIVTGAVFFHTLPVDEAISDILLLSSPCILFMVELMVS